MRFSFGAMISLYHFNRVHLNLVRKKDESRESDFKDAVNVCLPLIHSAVRDIEKGLFPKNCSLNIEVPSCPSTNKVWLCC